GDTAAAAVTWSATSGSITDTSTKGGRHYGKFKAGSDTGREKVIARGQATNLADTATEAVTPPPVASMSVSTASASAVPTATARARDGEGRRLGDNRSGDGGEERHIRDGGGERHHRVGDGQPGLGEPVRRADGAAGRDTEGFGRQSADGPDHRVVEQRHHDR